MVPLALRSGLAGRLLHLRLLLLLQLLAGWWSCRLVAGQSCGVHSVHVTLSNTQCPGPTFVFSRPPDDVAAGARIFVGCYSGDFIAAVTDANTGQTKVASFIPAAVCSGANGAAIHPRLPEILFVTCGSGGGTLALNITSGAISAAVTDNQCSSPYALSFDDLTLAMYVACFNGDVVAFDANNYSLDLVPDGARLTTVVTSARCPGPNSVVWNPLRRVLVVACNGDGQQQGGDVIELDPLSGAATSLLPPNTSCLVPFSTLTDGAGALFIACQGSSLLRRSSTGSVSMMASSTVCSQPTSFVFDPRTSLLTVACYAGAVLTIYINSTAIDEAAAAGNFSPPLLTYVSATADQCVLPYGVFADSAGELYASCYGSGVVQLQRRVVTLVTPGSVCPTPYSALPNPLGAKGGGGIISTCSGGGVVLATASSFTTLVTGLQCPTPYVLSTSAAGGPIVYIACGGGEASAAQPSKSSAARTVAHLLRSVSVSVLQAMFSR
jgi:hypothetical protein